MEASKTPEPDCSLPTLAEIRTFWRRPWLVNLLSQHGLRHFREGEPMQDAHQVGGNGRHSWIIVADGVSSATMSSHSSRMAVDSISDYLSKLDELPSRQDLLAALNHARENVLAMAARLGCETDDVATTVAFVVFSGQEIAAANIGDSSILAYTETDRLSGSKALVPLCSAMQPQAKYGTADEGIVPLTYANWHDYVEIAHKSTNQVDAIILGTDGANNFFTDDWEEPLLDPHYIANFQAALGYRRLPGRVHAEGRSFPQR